MEIIPFDYKSKSVRVIQDENGTLWWVAKDVCKILGGVYHISRRFRNA